MYELDETKVEIESDVAKLAVLYNEMMQMCLWGNATVCFSSYSKQFDWLTLAGSLLVNEPDTRRHSEIANCRERCPRGTKIIIADARRGLVECSEHCRRKKTNTHFLRPQSAQLLISFEDYVGLSRSPVVRQYQAAGSIDTSTY